MTDAAAGPRDASCFLGGCLEVAAPIFIQLPHAGVAGGFSASPTASDIILEVSK
jgi:hypothetical protein